MHAVVMHEFGAAEVLRPGEFSAPAERTGLGDRCTARKRAELA